MRKKLLSLAAFILVTAFIAGSLDAIAACIQFLLKGGKDPGIVFKFIASGITGRRQAFGGGIRMIVLGVSLHYFIALLFTIFYFLLYPITFLKKNVIISSMLYGAFTWVVMNLLVIPASLISQQPGGWKDVAIAMSVLIACIGFPVALMARKYYLYRK
jgi:hypothetical protein